MFKKKLISVLMATAMVVTMLPSGFGGQNVKAAATWRSALYPENWQPGYTNSQGQFLHDFSYAGYEKGEKEVPDSMSGAYADVTTYGADKTGATDSTTAIQNAINAVEAAGGGTVYLPEGTYKVKPSSGENSSALRIKGSNILFKGAGVGKTFIRCYAENMRYCQVINVSPNGGTWDSADDGKYYYLSKDISNAPTTTISLNDVGNLSVGDWVIIRSDRTQSWIDEHGMGGFWYASVNPTTMGTTFYRKITAVNKTNKTIEIDIPTRYYMKTRDNARVYKVSPKQSNVGLTDFSIGNKANSNSNGWGEEDYKTSGTGSYNVNNAFLIKFALNVNCFAKNIATYQAGNASQIHMSSNGLDINKTRNLTVDSCDFSYPQYEGGGGNGYGMNICGQETLIKNCSSTSARHSFSFKYSYANGNVIYHYKSTNPKYGSDFHMYLSMSNLIDNEELNGDFVESNVRPYGGTAGNRHGYTSTQTVFWNTKGNYYKSGYNYIIDSRQFGYGYIIGTQGSATGVKTTPTTMSSTYGTVNTAPEDYKEGIGTGADLYPQSLYYDQLQKRLSREASAATPKDVPGTFNATEYSSATSGITQQTTDQGVKYVGNLLNGSTLTYKIKAAKSGQYRIKLNLAAGDAQYNADSITVKINDNTVATVPINTTPSWTDFVEHTATINIPSAGESTLSLVAVNGACNIADIALEENKGTEVTTTVPQTTKAPETTQEETTKKEVKKGTRVVGYLPSYRVGSVNSIDFSALTHCCLSFMTYKNGTLTSGFSASNVQNIVNKCHSNGVKAMIAIGGGGGFDTSDGPFNTAAKRTSIVNQIMNYVNQYNLDGVDIDIEVTDGNVWNNFDAFCSELSGRLKASGKLFTMAVSSWFTDPIKNSTYNYFDFINLMTYDAAFGDGDVAPWSTIYNMISYYRNRGVSNDRMVIGVPFYGYGSGAKSYTYAEILAMDSSNSTRDYSNGIYYNGENTIRQKAEYSKDFGGTMIWELGQDSFSDKSLLKVIKDVMQTEKEVTVTKIPGKIAVNSYADKTSTITINTENNVTYAGNLNNGSYLDYQIDVPSAGEYTFHLNLAAGNEQYNAKNMIVKVDDNTVATVPITASSSWTTFIDHSVNVKFAKAGTYKFTVAADSGACNVADFTVEKYTQPETTKAPETTKEPETTKAPETTKEPETTKVPQTGEPIEVFGVDTKCEVNNTLEVVWGQNQAQIDLGQKYNVYIDGQKMLSEVGCASYTLTDLKPGKRQVRVTAVLNGKETTGVTLEVVILGENTTTKEEETTQTGIPVSNRVEINGHQISATVKGIRAVYSVEDTIDSKKVVEKGMIYSLASYASADDLYIGSDNKYVKSFAATEKGALSVNYSGSTTATSYAMTMRFASKSSEEYTIPWRVRAYAKLEDGSYVYSDSVEYTIYDVAKNLYESCKMNTIDAHNYLYNDILKVVDKNYEEKDYNWNNQIVLPE